MLVLGIESSCDETGVALYDARAGLLAHALHSQIATHRAHGGVVPELASRDHVNYLIPLIDEVLAKAGRKKNELDGVAYTAGPGLIGALLVGSCFAKSFAYGLGIPALGIHHLEAHILAAQMETPTLDFPFI
ncbi:MAG: tRNA (adenosine(37)-N6)-threonylcarbamoyltransferase complex transferase subunit TsaD, partial [Legionella sp.]